MTEKGVEIKLESEQLSGSSVHADKMPEKKLSSDEIKKISEDYLSQAELARHQIHDSMAGDNKLDEVKNSADIIESAIDEPVKSTRRGFLGKMAVGVGLLSAGGTIGAVIGKIKSESGEHKRDREKIVERTGIDLGEIAEHSGFDISLDVDNGPGPYIFHIGQTHKHPNEKVQSQADKIIAVQKNIESAVLLLQEKRMGYKIYNEGVADEKDYADILKDRDVLAKLEPNVDNYCTLANNLLGRGSALMGASEIGTCRTYLMYKKLEEMDLYFERNASSLTAEQTNKLKAAREILKKFLENKDGLLAGKDDIYIYGAGVKLLMDKKVAVKPAESIVTNEMAISAMKELDKAGDEVKKEEFKSLAFRAREDSAVQIISDTETGRDNVVVLIYGKKHNFADAVEARNKANPKKKFGLIKLTPK